MWQTKALLHHLFVSRPWWSRGTGSSSWLATDIAHAKAETKSRLEASLRLGDQYSELPLHRNVVREVWGRLKRKLTENGITQSTFFSWCTDMCSMELETKLELDGEELIVDGSGRDIAEMESLGHESPVESKADATDNVSSTSSSSSGMFWRLMGVGDKDREQGNVSLNTPSSTAPMTAAATPAADKSWMIEKKRLESRIAQLEQSKAELENRVSVLMKWSDS